MKPEDLLQVLALAVIFTPLEQLLPAGTRDWSPRRLLTDVLHLLVSGAMIRWGCVVAAVAIGWAIGQAAPGGMGQAVRSQPTWLQFAELFVLSDLCFYAAHRLVHSVPWLWRFHEIHHSSEHLDWLATYRVHPVDQILNSTIIALPSLVFGFAPLALLIYALVYRAHALLLHANIRLDFGPLKWVIASPHYHHWHHANEPAAYDRNFGGQLVIFDWLFGTLNMPAHRPAAFGVVAPVPVTFLGQLAHPFRRVERPRPAIKETA